jgi:hypothetical protein
MNLREHKKKSSLLLWEQEKSDRFNVFLPIHSQLHPCSKSVNIFAPKESGSYVNLLIMVSKLINILDTTNTSIIIHIKLIKISR